MPVIILEKKATKEEFEKAKKFYGDYIKTVLDIDREVLAVGGEFHVDCEEVLIRSGSKQTNLFGGGYRVSTKEVEFMAMSNYKPAFGMNTYEIMDPDVRKKMEKITKEFLER